MSDPKIEDADVPVEALFSMNEISSITEVMLDDGIVTTPEQFRVWLKLSRSLRVMMGAQEELDALEERSELDPDYIPF